MSAQDPIDRYLEEMHSKLHGNRSRIERVLAEVRDHLETSRRRYLERQLGQAEAARLAIQDFGDAQSIALSLNTVRMYGGTLRERALMMALAGAACVTSLYGAFVFVHTLAVPGDILVFKAAKLIGGALMVDQGLLTLAYFRGARLGSLFAVGAVGVACVGAVSLLHDLIFYHGPGHEYYAYALAMLLIVQGGASLLVNKLRSDWRFARS